MGKKENELKKNDQVCTPPVVYKPVLKALGWDAFDLDPCSHPDAIVPVHNRIMLPAYKGKPTADPETVIYADGLSLSWASQNVWKNQPYSQLQYFKKYKWLYKAAHEAKTCVSLLPVRTSSKWWQHEVVGSAQAICFLLGRVVHVGHEYGSPFHQALAFWGFTQSQLRRLEHGLSAKQNGEWWWVQL